MSEAHRTVAGFRHWPGNQCPYCRGDYFAIIDDGQAETYRVDCWCGGRSRVHRDDSDLVRAVLPP
jgi:hypothetical protein